MLNRHFEVHLVAFCDDEKDLDYERDLQGLCASVTFFEIKPMRRITKAVLAIFKGTPVSVETYSSFTVARLIDGLISEHSITRALAFSGGVAQYLDPTVRKSARILHSAVDLVDVDSDKWAQFSSESQSWLMRWIYRREARLLSRYEHRVAEFAGATFLVTEEERSFFCDRAPDVAQHVRASPNGVDTSYFDPDLSYSPIENYGKRVLAFTGAMDYWPNVEAVCWFVEEVYLQSDDLLRDFVFYVVGSKPTARVRALARPGEVVVTGRIDDVRPYLAAAEAAIVPIRVARGVQNKILEAMAMKVPVITTRECIRGIAQARPEIHYIPADDTSDYVRVLKDLESNDLSSIAVSARTLIDDHYSWSRALAPLIDYFFEIERKN